jgi:hypothetical protein
MSQEEAIQYMLERLKEPSTWRGFFVLLTALGVQIAPEKLDAVVTAGLGIAGLIGVFVPDKTNVVAALNFSDDSNKSDNS